MQYPGHRAAILGLTFAVFLTGFVGSSIGGARAQGSLVDTLRRVTDDVMEVFSGGQPQQAPPADARTKVETLLRELLESRDVDEFNAWRLVRSEKERREREGRPPPAQCRESMRCANDGDDPCPGESVVMRTRGGCAGGGGDCVLCGEKRQKRPPARRAPQPESPRPPTNNTCPVGTCVPMGPLPGSNKMCAMASMKVGCKETRNRCSPSEGCRGVCIVCPEDQVKECSATDCGPSPGTPNQRCLDGVTVSGPTGKCIRKENGQCGWEILECPSTPSTGPCTAGTCKKCPEGQYFCGGKCSRESCAVTREYMPMCGCDGKTYNNRGTAEIFVCSYSPGACEGKDDTTGQCREGSCGPSPGRPNVRCPDGVTFSGPTGKCIRKEDGKCGWETKQCPTGNRPKCGNGIVEPPEQCDDGNTSDNDACAANCLYRIVVDPVVYCCNTVSRTCRPQMGSQCFGSDQKFSSMEACRQSCS